MGIFDGLGWDHFLASYMLAVGALVYARLDLFRGTGLRALRVVIGVTFFLFLGDYIAEDRGFWLFAPMAPLHFLDVPVQNILFTASTVVLILVLYLLRKRPSP